ncbi:MAG: hypothetical protein AB1428_03080 [Bacteroidota bacterium]
MNLGQMMLVLGAIVLLGVLILNANATVYQATDTMYTSEFGVTAISLATSLVEEAMGKMFDQIIAGANPAAVYDSTLFTAPGDLRAEGSERYRGGANDFNDFDDFNNLFFVYKSDVPADSTPTPGSTYEFTIHGLRGKYFARTKVEYVRLPNLDVPYTIRPTWHKKLTVTVKAAGEKDSLVFPAVMSYWN